MSKNLDVALRLFLESRGLDAGIRRTGQNWTGTTRSMQRDALQLDKVVGGVQRHVALRVRRRVVEDPCVVHADDLVPLT